MLMPSDIRTAAAKRYVSQHKAWVKGEGSFPLRIPLGTPTEAQFLVRPDTVREWHDAWANWSSAGLVTWEERKWPRAGVHRLPSSLTLDTPQALADVAGKGTEWRQAVIRLNALAQLGAGDMGEFARFYGLALRYAPEEWNQLMSCLSYFMANPSPNLFVRQLPVKGVDTKWIGDHQPDLVQLLRQLKGKSGDADFYDVTGVRRPAFRVRVRLLCPELRAMIGGLRDFEIPLDELAAWTLRPTRLIIVENLESGLALEDVPGGLAIIGMGNAVTELGRIFWLANIPGLYWGDIDTYGLAIYGRLKVLLPKLQPMLMDLVTLLEHEPLWGREDVQHARVDTLDGEQQALFEQLTGPGPAQFARLEQERLPWECVQRALSTRLGSLTTTH